MKGRDPQPGLPPPFNRGCRDANSGFVSVSDSTNFDRGPPPSLPHPSIPASLTGKHPFLPFFFLSLPLPELEGTEMRPTSGLTAHLVIVHPSSSRHCRFTVISMSRKTTRSVLFPDWLIETAPVAPLPPFVGPPPGSDCNTDIPLLLLLFSK